jgi:hypothetical protein
MNDSWAWAQLRDLENSLESRHEILSDAISDAAQLLVRSPDDAPHPEIEKRVVAWLLEVLERFKERAGAARRRLESTRTDAEAAKVTGRLHDLVGDIVRRVYFGARADRRQVADDGGDSTSRVREYITLVRPIMRGILAFADPAGAGVLSPSAAHDFMQLLNIVLPFDPEEALDMAARVAASASATGYQFDSLAAKQVINLVEVVLADYRDRLTAGEALSNTLALLDIFAAAGWPEALKLVWRLDEVFR